MYVSLMSHYRITVLNFQLYYYEEAHSEFDCIVTHKISPARHTIARACSYQERREASSPITLLRLHSVFAQCDL